MTDKRIAEKKAIRACEAVLEWARTCSEKHGNPYELSFVKKAQAAITLADGVKA